MLNLAGWGDFRPSPLLAVGGANEALGIFIVLSVSRPDGVLRVSGAPGEIRTPDLLVRSPNLGLLAELW